MCADEALRCECGYEVQASDESARVDEVRRHASEAHGIDLSAEVALDVVRRIWPVPRGNCRTRDTACVKRHIDGGAGRTDPAATTPHRRLFR